MNPLLKGSVFFLGALFLLSGPGCSSVSDKLIRKNKDADQTRIKREKEKGVEVTQKGLEGGLSTPIASEEGNRTSVSRPRVVKVEEVGKRRRGKKYFEVVDDRHKTELAPAIDKAARPIRIVTYDNNSVQRDYRMRFGVAWGRVIESLLELPLSVVDRSSGLIVTDWIMDQADVSEGASLLNPFGAKEQSVRYKYTIRMLDRGNMIQIKVIPFTQVIKDMRWTPAKPSVVVADRMFVRIERELSVPLPSERD